jgi:transposase-like protein
LRSVTHCGTPNRIAIDKSGANTSAIESHNTARNAGIEMRQIEYLNNIVEQDPRAIKRRDQCSGSNPSGQLL